MNSGNLKVTVPVYYTPYHYTLYTPAQAMTITPEELKTKPFFKPQPEELFDSNESIAMQYANDHFLELLAIAFPARTYAMAANELSIPHINLQEDINMQVEFKDALNHWPRPTGEDNWWHSDIKDVDYIYVYEAYDKIVEYGGLHE